MGFIGPNGAGKTTAIKVILGLLNADGGSVRIFGNDIAKDHIKALAHVGAIIESPELYTYMSGYDNLMQCARICGVDKTRVMECAQIVGLDSRINDKVSRYSLGMRQRLGVAQAILNYPGLLILDEPTNGLDPDGIMDLRRLLRELADNGVSVLVSSHILAELEHICDSVCIIENGFIVSRRNLSVTDDDDRLMFRIEVGNAENAYSILTRAGYETECAKNSVVFKAHREDVPHAVSALVFSGCDVFSVTEKKVTLEDAYIEATGFGHSGR